jgi:hypothetical protein
LQTYIQSMELPLPDKARLKGLIDEEFRRLSQKRRLQLKIDPASLDAAAANLCGLTEQEAERAVSQAIVSRYGLLPEIVHDVLDAKREILKRSGTLEFIPTPKGMDNVAGLENLKSWLRRRRNACTPEAIAAGLEPPKGVVILGVQGLRKVALCTMHRRRVADPAREIRRGGDLRQVHRRDGEAPALHVPGGGTACALRAVDRRARKDLRRQQPGLRVE